jgi:hypothetical protein
MVPAADVGSSAKDTAEDVKHAAKKTKVKAGETVDEGKARTRVWWKRMLGIGKVSRAWGLVALLRSGV